MSRRTFVRIATRDYARPQRPKSGPPPKGGGSARAVPRRSTSPRGGKQSVVADLPLWVWMVVGLSLLIAAFAIYSISRPAAPMDMAPSSDAKALQTAKTIEIPPKEPSRFAFYEMLPSYEVVVPDEVLNPSKLKPGTAANNLPGSPADKPASRPNETVDPAAILSGARPVVVDNANVEPRSAASKPASIHTAKPVVQVVAPPQPTAQLAQGERFLIQVAAFRAKADAEQRVAALTLAGLSARVEQVTIDRKDTWYRVRLGPYGSAAAASSAQQTLKAQGFNGVVMKVKS